MELLLDGLSWITIISGSLFCIIGAFGVVTLPDFFCRMHGASVIDTMGLGLILLGLGFQTGLTLALGKLVMIFVFIFFTSPTGTHALARAALYSGLDPVATIKPRTRMQ